MLSAVLKSERAVEMSIFIVRAFVRMWELLASHKALASRVEKLEAGHRRHASVINILAEEIGDLKTPKPLPPKRRIGFPPPKGLSESRSRCAVAGKGDRAVARGPGRPPYVLQWTVGRPIRRKT